MVHPNPLHCLSLLSQLPGVRFDINILPYQVGRCPVKYKNKLQDPLPCQPWSAYLPPQHGARYPKQACNKHNNSGRSKHGSVTSRRTLPGRDQGRKQSSCFDYFYVSLSDSRTVKFIEIYPYQLPSFRLPFSIICCMNSPSVKLLCGHGSSLPREGIRHVGVCLIKRRPGYPSQHPGRHFHLLLPRRYRGTKTTAIPSSTRFHLQLS